MVRDGKGMQDQLLLHMKPGLRDSASSENELLNTLGFKMRPLSILCSFDHSHHQMQCSRKKVGCSIRSPTGVLFVHRVLSARQGHLGNDHPNEWELRMHKFPSLQVFK